MEPENPYQTPTADPLSEEVVPKNSASRGERLADNRLIGKFAMGFISLQGLSQVIGNLYVFKVESMGDGAIRANAVPFVIAAALPVIFLIPAASTYGVWLYRTAANAQRLKGRPLDISPAMSIGSYFIPFYWFVGPFTSMREIADVTFRAAPKLRPSSLITIWWLSFLISIITQRLSRTTLGHEGSLTGLALWDLAAVVICIIIHRLSKMQSEIEIPIFIPPPAGTRPPGPRFAGPPVGLQPSRPPTPRSANLPPEWE